MIIGPTIKCNLVILDMINIMYVIQLKDKINLMLIDIISVLFDKFFESSLVYDIVLVAIFGKQLFKISFILVIS